MLLCHAYYCILCIPLFVQSLRSSMFFHSAFASPEEGVVAMRSGQYKAHFITRGWVQWIFAAKYWILSQWCWNVIPNMWEYERCAAWVNYRYLPCSQPTTSTNKIAAERVVWYLWANASQNFWPIRLSLGHISTETMHMQALYMKR